MPYVTHTHTHTHTHRKDIKIFGIDVIVPDIYPILKYPEVAVAKKQSSKRNTPSLLSETSIDSRSTDLRSHFMTSTNTSVSIPIQASHDQSHDPQPKSHDITPDSHDAMCGNHGNISGVIVPQVQVSHTEGGVLESDGDSCAHRVVGIDQIDLEFEKLTKKRHRLLNKTSSSSSVVGEDTGSERSSSTSTLKSPSRAGSWEKRLRTSSFERYVWVVPSSLVPLSVTHLSPSFFSLPLSHPCPPFPSPPQTSITCPREATGREEPRKTATCRRGQE